MPHNVDDQAGLFFRALAYNHWNGTSRGESDIAENIGPVLAVIVIGVIFIAIKFDGSVVHRCTILVSNGEGNIVSFVYCNGARTDGHIPTGNFTDKGLLVDAFPHRVSRADRANIAEGNHPDHLRAELVSFYAKSSTGLLFNLEDAIYINVVVKIVTQVSAIPGN